MADTPKRQQLCKKVYVNKDGSETAHAGPDVDHLDFRFADTEKTVKSVALSAHPADIRGAFGWNGLAQKYGDTYAGAEDVEEAIERFETIGERLMSGEWVKAREGAGPMPSMVFDAVMEVLAAKGQDVDEKTEAKIRDHLSTVAGRKSALEKATVKAAYERLRAARQADRVKAADKAAKAAGDEDVLAGIA